MIEPVTTFRTARAARRSIIGLAGAMDAFDPHEPYTRAFLFVEGREPPWTFSAHDEVICALCLWRDPAPGSLRYFAALAESGKAIILTPTIDVERIVPSDRAHHGYLIDIEQIGGRLYVCGNGGQVYRRESGGHWVTMDDGIVRGSGSQATNFIAQVIGGAHESSIYVAGCDEAPHLPPHLEHWDGTAWSRVALPQTAGRITNMYVESETRVWLCGAKGTLLLGNVREGFHSVGPSGGNHLFLSVTAYKGAMYLASNLGLVRLAGSVFEDVKSGLTPEIRDANIVDVADDVLWSIGTKDIVRYDGQTWERFQHPDNPLIA